jgi:phytoene synthase
VSERELDAAGVADPVLRTSYERCRRLLAAHGRTYALATRFLPPAKRPYVHALYGFARYSDELVDDLTDPRPLQQRADRLDRWTDLVLTDLQRGRSHDPVAAALVDTVSRWDIPHEHVADFLAAMRSDLTVRSYATYADLQGYMYGSAGVIGLAMLPILEPRSPDAAGPAVDLGIAFQLANFVRDVGEDLDRGRVYLPLDELAEFGVRREDLQRRVVTPGVRAALAYQAARVRSLGASAQAGIELLHPSSRPCIEAARVLYCGIVDAVEAADYQVFDARAVVPMRRRLAVALPAWLRAGAARRRHGPGAVPQPSARTPSGG